MMREMLFEENGDSLWRHGDLPVHLTSGACGEFTTPGAAMANEQEFLDGCRTAYAAGENLDEMVYEDSGWSGKRTRLYQAARDAWSESVQWLLEHGADPNADGTGTDSGMKPLHIAASSVGIPDARSLKCSALLLDAGAFVNALNSLGRPPIFYAAAYGNMETLKLLLSRGASLEACTSFVCEGVAGNLEAFARRRGKEDAADLLADVGTAGGWAAYVSAPRIELLEFRRRLPTLRREPPSAPAPLERLFADPKVPDDVLTHVLSFWRSSRDYPPPLSPPKKEPAGKAKVWTLEAVEKLTVPKLKSELKKLKLDQAGRKAELKQRLLEGLGLAKAE